MFKQSGKKIAALALVFVIGAGSTAFAKTSTTPSSTKVSGSTTTKKGGFRGEGFEKLITDLGLTKDDLDKARGSSKTIFDLAKEKKGLSADKVREMLIKNDTESINKAVSEGKLTKEEGKKIIANIKEKIAKWDGSIKKHPGGPHGDFRALKELGLTKEDIDEAKKSNKTIFDIAKEKKGLSADKVREIMIKSNTEHINEKVSEGKITKEKAAEIISNMKTRIQNWDGKLK